MELYEYNGCYKYKCLGDNVGFRSINDKTCITCPPRSGVLTSGVCSTPCNEIQHFDREKQECVTNTAYTHAELKYGKGNMVSRGFEHDCWPLLNEDEYTNCVVNGGR